MSALSVEAFAKVNRSLRVLGKRPDGYHELDTIFQTVDLTEEIDFLEGEEGTGEVSLTVEGADLPADSSNLVLRAANALRERFSVRRGARIHLSKKIPIGGGLGGGSSNAAATLRALTSLWRLPATNSDLHSLAAALGSDVPFFLVGGRARGTGRGEILRLLPDGPEEWLVLVFPPFSLSTAAVYGALSAPALTDSAAPTNLRGSDSSGGPDRNDLEPAAESLRGELKRFRAALSDHGATSARLSGSGSTVFGVFGDEKSARRAFEGLAGLQEEMMARMTIVKTVSKAVFARRAMPYPMRQRG
ncbi:MAG TPA: 4-(cytidine 5'-diphospho)-2-C-methyl-D-erythritol kinase [Thermoanaerobaculia bacterium]|nr:4-(cytidine 5'-diphospho)-2-C-methyl-D-erythritol kinase [Thermoanaerobaculia bacterium]